MVPPFPRHEAEQMFERFVALLRQRCALEVPTAA